MDLGLTGQVAFVTAASRGLGFAVARALALEGCRVAICARGEEGVARAAARLRGEAGVDVAGIPADLSGDGEPERFAREAAQALGPPHVLVANTGYPRPAAFDETTTGDFDEAYRTLLRPVQALVRACLPAMEARGYGRVLAVASVAVEAPIERLVLSNAVRVGVAGLMKTLAREAGPKGIHCNTVCPGFHRTERLEDLAEAEARREGTDAASVLARMAARVPVGRLGDPDDFGAVCAFLVSPRCAYVNGAMIQVDGGLYEGLV